MAGGERSVIVSGRSTAGNGVGRINQRFLRFGRRAGTLKREGSGRFGLAEILSVLFFPNSVGPQERRIIKALLDGMIIKYQTKQMMGNLSS